MKSHLYTLTRITGIFILLAQLSNAYASADPDPEWDDIEAFFNDVHSAHDLARAGDGTAEAERLAKAVKLDHEAADVNELMNTDLAHEHFSNFFLLHDLEEGTIASTDESIAESANQEEQLVQRELEPLEVVERKFKEIKENPRELDYVRKLNERWQMRLQAALSNGEEVRTVAIDFFKTLRLGKERMNIFVKRLDEILEHKGVPHVGRLVKRYALGDDMGIGDWIITLIVIVIYLPFFLVGLAISPFMMIMDGSTNFLRMLLEGMPGLRGY